MVCKENVVSWFGNLSSYKRIDVMCTLLNMCLPFEVRYLGTCVEDLGKRDYNVLRDTEHRANNVSDLAELTNLGMTDKRTRRKLALYMALLHSCNYSCAVILYKNLSNFDLQEISNLLSGTNFAQDDQPLEELLLLYTMALNHPAFNYEQKSTFGNIFLKLQEEEARLSLPKTETPFKSTQGCIPCVNQNDRMDPEISNNCVVPPPPMQAFQGEMPMRGNAMIAGMPPSLAIPPPSLCIPTPEQLAMHGAAGHPQYVHVGFPSVNHMPPWPGQMMMAHNQFMYHPTDVLPPYPTSPMVSRQSSPSQSQSHSRSNSPTGQLQRKSNNGNNSNNNGPIQQQPRTSCQVTQSTSNTMTTSTSTSSNQTNITNSPALGTSTSLPLLPSLSSNRGPGPQQSQQLPPLLPTRPLAPMSNTVYTRHNNVELTVPTTSSKQQQPPPPRLKSSLSGDSLRENVNKETANYKGNYQNCSNNEIRRLSDEDISKVDMSSNVLNNMKTQAANGLNQTPEKKIDSPNNVHSTIETMENEIIPMENIPNDNSNMKPVTIPDQAMMNYHHQNHTVMANMRRYPPPLDPTHIQMFPAPPAMYPAQNACYSCLTTVPMAGMQNRFSRCNGPQVYCFTQLQSLRLDPENSRHCSQSSSSDSTGSRSPPETPPAVPWIGNDNNALPPTSEPQQQHPGGGPPPIHSIPSTHSGPQQINQERQRPRKSQAHMMRHKNHSSTAGMVNGGAPPPPPPGSLQPCITYPAGPPGHTPMTAYLPHHAHFPALRPATGIYSNFSHAYARPAPAGYPTIAYQPNGEMMYQYPGHPPPGSSTAVPTAATGTPPPPPAAVAAASATVAVQSTPSQLQQQPAPPQQQQGQQQQSNFTPAAPTSYAPSNSSNQSNPSNPPLPNPVKVSCYNCGSSSHTAPDCKEQTMEDITRRAQFRLDYATMKQSGGEQVQSSDK